MKLTNTLKGFEKDRKEAFEYGILKKIHFEINKIHGYENGYIFQNTRKRSVIENRQLFYYLARKHTYLSYEKIGSYKGQKHHATVIHGIKRISDYLTYDKNLKRKIETIETKL